MNGILDENYGINMNGILNEKKLQNIKSKSHNTILAQYLFLSTRSSNLAWNILKIKCH